MINNDDAVARLKHWRYAIRIQGVEEVISLVQEQAAEIERLKCCANCQYYEEDEITYICTLNGYIMRMDEKCDKWELKGGE